jgi:hypothetical protein
LYNSKIKGSAKFTGFRFDPRFQEIENPNSPPMTKTQQRTRFHNGMLTLYGVLFVLLCFCIAPSLAWVIVLFTRPLTDTLGHQFALSNYGIAVMRLCEFACILVPIVLVLRMVMKRFDFAKLYARAINKLAGKLRLPQIEIKGSSTVRNA